MPAELVAEPTIPVAPATNTQVGANGALKDLQFENTDIPTAKPVSDLQSPELSDLLLDEDAPDAASGPSKPNNSLAFDGDPDDDNTPAAQDTVKADTSTPTIPTPQEPTTDLHNSALGKEVRAKLAEKDPPKDSTITPEIDIKAIREKLPQDLEPLRVALNDIRAQYPDVDFSQPDFAEKLRFDESLTPDDLTQIQATVAKARNLGFFDQRSVEIPKPQSPPEPASPALDLATITAEQFQTLLTTEGANRTQLIRDLIQNRPDEAIQWMKSDEINILHFADAVGEPLPENTSQESRDTIARERKKALASLYNTLFDEDNFTVDNASYYLAEAILPDFVEADHHNAITFENAKHELATLTAASMAPLSAPQDIDDYQNMLGAIAIAKEPQKTQANP